MDEEQKDRDENGKFKKGNPGGPGRPKRHIELEYLTRTFTACDLNAWQDIIKTTVELARKGDPAARAFLANYILESRRLKTNCLLRPLMMRKTTNFFRLSKSPFNRLKNGFCTPLKGPQFFRSFLWHKS